VPTAQASRVETAATAKSRPCFAAGLGTRRHAAPFQCPISVPSGSAVPTAQASRAETAATPFKMPLTGTAAARPAAPGPAAIAARAGATPAAAPAASSNAAIVLA